MSNTPRTDAEQWTAGVGDDDRTVVWSDFARDLERENTVLRQEAKQLAGWLCNAPMGLTASREECRAASALIEKHHYGSTPSTPPSP